MANNSIVNSITLAAMDNVAEQILERLREKNKTITWLSRVTGISRTTIYRRIEEDRYQPAHLGTYIVIFDALGFDEITIRWRKEI